MPCLRLRSTNTAAAIAQMPSARNTAMPPPTAGPTADACAASAGPLSKGTMRVQFRVNADTFVAFNGQGERSTDGLLEAETNAAFEIDASVAAAMGDDVVLLLDVVVGDRVTATDTDVDGDAVSDAIAARDGVTDVDGVTERTGDDEGDIVPDVVDVTVALDVGTEAVTVAERVDDALAVGDARAVAVLDELPLIVCVGVLPPDTVLLLVCVGVGEGVSVVDAERTKVVLLV